MPIEYYVKFPPLTEDHQIIIVDPMLATGRSMSHAIKQVKKNTEENI